MKHVIASTAFALSLGVGSVANAGVVVFQQSGNTNVLDLFGVGLPGGGNYRFEATSSIPVTFEFLASYDEHWDIFLAPPPRPHSEFIEGNSSPIEGAASGTGLAFSWTFLVPETKITFFDAGPVYEVYGIPIGAPLYEEVKADNPFFGVFVRDGELGRPFDYSFTVTRLAPIPEPATWVGLILGFGMLGAALRRHRARIARVSAVS
ncbi:PEPxxWA-CTERM sorting domain-containing protein [Phenylobacterium sp.]|uniref:PEPxxWA-CTERM sorting domain-containing protein n=1 Tax=Phenylobacterium sp. TaxID=1871053 RepID=UPI00289B1721|nr:PEPxxWA-CTERM sorting domain-containing protein [Phenylobacterium sp.]